MTTETATVLLNLMYGPNNTSNEILTKLTFEEKQNQPSLLVVAAGFLLEDIVGILNPEHHTLFLLNILFWKNLRHQKNRHYTPLMQCGHTCYFPRIIFY
jgi:hypothetical protein